jgi:membrane protease YdiL (CAAX protease family)
MDEIPVMKTVAHLRDWLEITSAYGLILSVIWTPMPIQRILFWIAFGWIVFVTVLRNESFSALGLGKTGFLQSLWIVVAALVLAGIAAWVAVQAGTLHPLFGRKVPLGLRICVYALWAFLQEFILQAYVLLRLLRSLPNRRTAIALAAVLFAAAHLPNPLLTVLTLLWGCISCTLYLRYRSLYALSIAHAILGLSIAITVPDSIHRHMRVGLGYITYSSNSGAPRSLSK